MVGVGAVTTSMPVTKWWKWGDITLMANPQLWASSCPSLDCGVGPQEHQEMWLGVFTHDADECTPPFALHNTNM